MKLRWENKNSLGNRLRMNRVKFPYVGGQFGDGSYVKYAYDKTSQLLSERMFLANDTEFLKQEIPALGGYDDAGNRLQYNVTDHGIEKQIQSAYDEANQLNARNVRFPSIPNQSWQTTYANDLRGNRTQKVQPAGAGLEAEQWDYTFNIFNKMTKVEITKLGVKTEFGFKYGADGYRVEKFWGTVESPTDVRKFIMDGVHVILEKDAEGETKVRYIPGVCMITRDYNNQPVIRYYHQDALGSNVAMTDEEQNITALYQSDAWGNELLATEDIPNPYRWNGASGYYHDNDAQMYLLGMRWYDAETGRFVSRDPIGFEGGDVNFLAYVGNNPNESIDSSGLNGSFKQQLTNAIMSLLALPGSPGGRWFGGGQASALLFIPVGGPTLAGVGAEISVSAVVTSKLELCVTLQGNLLFGIGGLASAGIGPAGGYSSGSLEGAATTLGVGGGAGKGLGGNVSVDAAIDFNTLKYQGVTGAAGVIGPTGGIAGYARAGVSCTGCASLFLGYFAPGVAVGRAVECVWKSAQKLLGKS